MSKKSVQQCAPSLVSPFYYFKIEEACTFAQVTLQKIEVSFFRKNLNCKVF